jgi:hypothetical protein
VIVEAIDKDGNALGQSKIVKTIPADDMDTPAVDEEMKWLEEIESPAHMIVHEAKHAVSNPVATFFGGVVFTAVVIFIVWRFGRRKDSSSWWKRGRYSRVDGEAEDYDETKLDDMSSSDGYKGSQERFQLDDDEEDDLPARAGTGLNGRTPYVRQVSSNI